jgi:TonB family protein
MTIRWIALALFASVPIFAGDKGDSLPAPISQPEPDYGPELSKYYLQTPTRLTLVIDDRGVPFSLSGGALSDEVVTAISQWRYRPGKKDGTNVPFTITFLFPVRSALNTGVERSQTRHTFFGGSKDIAAALRSGTGLDSSAADALEQSFGTDLNNPEGRIRLLIYSGEIAASNPKEAAERRARHIEFLVQYLPGENVLTSPFALINTTGGPLPDPDAYRQVRDLWLNQLSLKPDDPAILERATYFLRVSDPEKAEQLLLPALSAIPDAPLWLGDLYGLAILGVNGVDLKTGLAVSASPTLPDTAFTKRARAGLLASTTDLRILLAAMNTLTRNASSLARASALPDGYAPLCQQLLERVKDVYPGTAASCDPSAAAPENAVYAPAGPPQRIRVGGNVQQAQLRKKVTPLYPPDAKARGIQGVVRFTALIGKDGTMENLSLVSGPLALYKSARDAVLQWIYRPTQLNGAPVEVVTTIEVNFTLSR